MNIKKITIDEVDLYSPLLEEGLSAILHTILFVRAPKFIKPEDFNCRKLAPLVYAKCGPDYVNQTVKEAIRELNKVKIPISPGIFTGVVSISFFEMKQRKAYLGLANYVDKIYFERWEIPILIKQVDSNDDWLTIKPSNILSYDNNNNLYTIELTRNLIQQRIASILDFSNQFIDHIPYTEYEYEIEVKSDNNMNSNNIDITQAMINKLLTSPITLNNT